jgi:germination protein M
MPGTRVVRPLTVVAALVALVLGVSACGDDDVSTGGTTAETPATTSGPPRTTGPSGTSATTAPAQTTAPVQREVNVYFVLGEKVAAAGRSVTGEGIAAGAIEALLAGPQGIESEMGMATEIPGGTELLGLDIADGLATVDLSGDFQSGGGSLSMTARVAQVVFTLTQFDTVDRVTIHLDGAPVEGIGGEGVAASELTRGDFADLTPFILVEEPAPGEATPSPLTVRGSANVFEGTVSWNLTDNDGRIIEEGFVTAAMGEWMPFEFTVDYEVDRPGLGAIILFQESPRDGSPEHVVEIPLELG